MNEAAKCETATVRLPKVQTLINDNENNEITTTSTSVTALTAQQLGLR
jgi:hypothetical protein